MILIRCCFPSRRIASSEPPLQVPSDWDAPSQSSSSRTRWFGAVGHRARGCRDSGLTITRGGTSTSGTVYMFYDRRRSSSEGCAAPLTLTRPASTLTIYGSLM